MFLTCNTQSNKALVLKQMKNTVDNGMIYHKVKREVHRNDNKLYWICGKCGLTQRYTKSPMKHQICLSSNNLQTTIIIFAFLNVTKELLVY